MIKLGLTLLVIGLLLTTFITIPILFIYGAYLKDKGR